MPKKQRIYDYFSEFASEALHIVIFEIFVKSMTSCLSKLKVTPSFCFAFKIPDNVTASTKQGAIFNKYKIFLNAVNYFRYVDVPGLNYYFRSKIELNNMHATVE